MTAGKKEYITLKKDKRQKRYLLENLRNLHKIYLTMSKYPLSYQSFCKLKPFWVLKPKVEDRETCRCLKHLNFEYLVLALGNAKVIEAKTSNDVIRTMCCDPVKANCLFRKCQNCKDKHLKINEFTDKICTYCKWTSVKSKCVIRGTEKIIRKSTKVTVPCTLVNTYYELEKSLDGFFIHSGNIFHQHNEISTLKSTLKSNEVLIHVDFSENIACKYAEEIQSFHFGG